MGRREDLESFIRDSYHIIRNYEEAIRTSDRPEEKQRGQQQIDEQWELIWGYLTEYSSLVEANLPRDIAEIAAHFADEDPAKAQSLRDVSRDESLPSKWINRGLVALARLMEAPRVRDKIVSFRTEFNIVRARINVMRHYKGMHSCLHDLYFQCYKPIAREVKRFPDDEEGLDSLRDYGRTLEEIVGEMRSVADQGMFAEHEISWIRHLDQVYMYLCQALERSDRALLERAQERLYSVLTVRLPYMNNRLNQAAHDLDRLADLVEGLKYICNTWEDCRDLDEGEVQWFKAGVDEMERLYHMLSKLLKEHDTWQWVDSELRMMAISLDNAAELAGIWEGVRAITKPLYCDRTEGWTIVLKEADQRLTDALVTREADRIERCFGRYRWRVDDCFYKTDIKLKRLCDDLRAAGDPLDAVMRMM
jgi:hypothetical protein